jgi:predicted TIM-barrel fold metal-dependent hydrolase
MRIVDAQIHLWGSGLPSNRAHRQVTSFTTEEAVGLMDEGGVDAAVIHPPGWDPNSTEMAFKAVRDFPSRFAILGAFPLSSPDKHALVEKWRSQPGMLGLRYGFLQEPMRGRLADGTLDWLWVAAERAGVPIAMLATDSLPHIGRMAERHPGLRLTIDHLGGRGDNTSLKDDAAMEHMPAPSSWHGIPTSPSRRPARQAIAADRTRSPACTSTCARSTTPSARRACSGEPTSRR